MTTEQQAKYWRYAAWTAPFAALAILIGEIFLGFDSIVNITSIIITTIFITTSVFWWWWAVSKIVQMMESSKRVEDNFLELSKELKDLKRDVDSREWREPQNNQDR